MRGVLRLLVLPLRAPMLLLLLAVAVYLGVDWGRELLSDGDAMPFVPQPLFWSARGLQAMAVVVICTIPDLLLRRLSLLMAASRVASLVVTLLLVTVGGLYLLHLEALADVLILAAAVLLARLDLVRIRFVPEPLPAAIGLTLWVALGLFLGQLWLPLLRPPA